jgi:hypothetical protein
MHAGLLVLVLLPQRREVHVEVRGQVLWRVA